MRLPHNGGLPKWSAVSFGVPLNKYTQRRSRPYPFGGYDVELDHLLIVKCTCKKKRGTWTCCCYTVTYTKHRWYMCVPRLLSTLDGLFVCLFVWVGGWVGGWRRVGEGGRPRAGWVCGACLRFFVSGLVCLFVRDVCLFICLLVCLLV